MNADVFKQELLALQMLRRVDGVIKLHDLIEDDDRTFLILMKTSDLTLSQVIK